MDRIFNFGGNSNHDIQNTHNGRYLAAEIFYLKVWSWISPLSMIQQCKNILVLNKTQLRRKRKM